MDSIIAGIEKLFPENKINTEVLGEPQKNLEFISSRITSFIRAMIDSGEYDECNYGVVIDVFQLLPCDYIKFIDNSKCNIYYFLSSDVTPDEGIDILKRFDTPKDYTYYRSDEEKKIAQIL